VKSAINGADPNWGRIACAAGRSGAAVDADKIAITLNRVQVMKAGMPMLFNEQRLRSSLEGREVTVEVSLGVGGCTAIAWGCDLSQDYVTINASYTT